MKQYKFNKDVSLAFNLIPICDCGTSEDCWEWLTGYLEGLEQEHYAEHNYEDPDWKYVQIINGFLEQADIVEHGSSCRCSWLTPQGKDILKALKIMRENDFDFDPDFDSEYGKWFWIESDDGNDDGLVYKEMKI